MDTLYSLVCYVPSAEDGQKHRIVESTLTDDKKFKTTIIKELEEFEGRENIEVIGNLIYKDGHLYSLLFYTDKNEVWKYDIFDYDIKTKKVSLKNIPDYTSSEFVAMDTQQGIVINEDDMYFVSDNGDVHQINLETQKPQILYNLYEIYSSKDLAELSSPLLSIKENNLYIYYSTKDSYFLDKLDLKTGEIIQSNEMEGMEKALSFKKSVNPYYLLVLD